MALEHDSESALAAAVRAAGSQSAFARVLSTPDNLVRQSTVREWLLTHQRLPAEYVLRAEAATGVSRHDLRPDIYPREEAA